MTEITMNSTQFFKLKNDPLHYDLNILYNAKEDRYEVECMPHQAKRIREIIK